MPASFSRSLVLAGGAGLVARRLAREPGGRACRARPPAAAEALPDGLASSTGDDRLVFFNRRFPEP